MIDIIILLKEKGCLFSKFKYYIMIFLLFLSYSNVSANRVFWWTVVPSADITDSGGYGVSLGQTAIGPVLSDTLEGNYGFWYEGFEPTICFYLSDSIWNIDSISLCETRIMEAGEEILITNCGNCHLNFGLYFMGADSGGWECGYTIDVNKFVLRGCFTRIGFPPTRFQPENDLIKASMRWANHNIFGSHGYNLFINNSFALWFEFTAPSRSSHFGHNIINVALFARTVLP
ncbi:hypothetical protein JXI42_01715 [bacterium]|nr:hypothetical protein [bacterium]